MCKNCNNDDVAVIQTPYAFKLFIQELETMGIQPRLNTEDIDMPVDQAELIEDVDAALAALAADADADTDDDETDDDVDAAKAAKAADDNDIKVDNDSSQSVDDIDPYTLFNAHIDNFATKNTIIDEKVWVDTFSNNFGGDMKGGGEDEEDSSEDSNDSNDSNDDDEEEEVETDNVSNASDVSDASDASDVSDASDANYESDNSEASKGGSSEASDYEVDEEELWSDSGEGGNKNELKGGEANEASGTSKASDDIKEIHITGI
jgi:hypothetical protein